MMIQHLILCKSLNQNNSNHCTSNYKPGQIKSKNSFFVSHLRRSTTSSFIIAICAAGPLKPNMPSLRKTNATSLSIDIGIFCKTS